MDETGMSAQGCGYKSGKLPSCAPLAVSFVPPQTDADNRYEPDKALARGTVFPGLDLPLGNIVNKNFPATPLGTVMALDFACQDLSLYLDSHPNDKEAFSVYRGLLRLSEKAKSAYTEKYGAICKTDLADANEYSWLHGPWPWEADMRKEG